MKFLKVSLLTLLILGFLPVNSSVFTIEPQSRASVTFSQNLIPSVFFLEAL
jgi:hypothetical protein